MYKGEVKEYILPFQSDTKKDSSSPAHGKSIIFTQLQPSDVLLYLYEQEVEKARAYLQFILYGLKNNARVLYATFDKNDKLNTTYFSQKYADKLHIISTKKTPEKNTNALLSSLRKKLSALCDDTNSSTSVRVITDFHTLPIHQIKKTAQYIIKRSKEIKLIGITAHAVTSSAELEELIKMHQKVSFLTDQNGGIIFCRTMPSSSVPAETISVESMEKLVKNNLENLTLFLLTQQPMCGYDLIKTIAQRFHVFLSQGTVYPLLYTLTSEGLLKVKNTLKAKIYYPPKEAKKTIQKKLKEFTKAQKFLFGLFSEQSD